MTGSFRVESFQVKKEVYPGGEKQPTLPIGAMVVSVQKCVLSCCEVQRMTTVTWNSKIRSASSSAIPPNCALSCAECRLCTTAVSQQHRRGCAEQEGGGFKDGKLAKKRANTSSSIQIGVTRLTIDFSLSEYSAASENAFTSTLQRFRTS